MSEAVQLNLFPFLLEALSLNSKSYKKIDALYDKFPDKFYNAAISSDYINHPIAHQGNLQHDFYYIKALGIFEISLHSEDITNELCNIMEYSWSYCSSYIKNIKKLTLSDFLCKYIKKHKGIANISDDELNSAILITIEIANMYDIPIDINDNVYMAFCKYISDRLEFYNNFKINLNRVSKKDGKLIKNIQDDLASKNTYIHQPLGKKINYDEKSSLGRFYLSLDFVFDTENISFSTLVGNDFLSSKDIQELIFCYLCMLDDEEKANLNEDDLEIFMYAATAVKLLCKSYNKAKKYFFNTIEKNNANNIKSLHTKIENLENENQKLIDENKTYAKNDEIQSKEIKRLTAKLNNIADNSQELIALRELIFNSSNKSYTSNLDKSNNIDLNKLKDSNNVIIGGSPSWQARMKKLLPAWTFIDTSTLNFDKDLLNKEHVFINTGFISHAMYYKIIENIKSTTKLHYLNNINSEICIKHIYNEIT